MWHRELTAREYSGDSNLQFLWQHDDLPIYIMDNHRAAFWCWRRHRRPDDPYCLFHIDWHWDAAFIDDTELNQIKSNWDALKELQFFDTMTSHRSSPTRDPIRTVRWDNYIDPWVRLCPSIQQGVFATHQASDVLGSPALKKLRAKGVVQVYPMEPAFSWLGKLLDDAKAPSIVNIDLDYFFTNVGDAKLRTFSDEFIDAVFRTVRECLPKIAALTICLSPDCCNGWVAAEEACKVATNALGIDFALP